MIFDIYSSFTVSICTIDSIYDIGVDFIGMHILYSWAVNSKEHVIPGLTRNPC